MVEEELASVGLVELSWLRLAKSEIDAMRTAR